MKNTLLVFITLYLLSCTAYQTSATTIQENSRTSVISNSNGVSAKELASLKEEWKTEILSQEGEAPVVRKYNDERRNKMLAKKGAVLDAQRKLAEKIGTIRLSSSTTMRDFETSDYVKSQIAIYLKEITVVSERYDEELETYFAIIEMPKSELVSIIEKHLQY